MRLTEPQVAVGLFPLEHCVHVKVLVFRLRCLAHRMMTFGFESFVNTYEPRELVMLACFLPPYQHNVVLLEAYRRGDAALKAWLDEQLPEIFPHAVDAEPAPIKAG